MNFRAPFFGPNQMEQWASMMSQWSGNAATMNCPVVWNCPYPGVQPMMFGSTFPQYMSPEMAASSTASWPAHFANNQMMMVPGSSFPSTSVSQTKPPEAAPKKSSAAKKEPKESTVSKPPAEESFASSASKHRSKSSRDRKRSPERRRSRNCSLSPPRRSSSHKSSSSRRDRDKYHRRSRSRERRDHRRERPRSRSRTHRSKESTSSSRPSERHKSSRDSRKRSRTKSPVCPDKYIEQNNLVDEEILTKEAHVWVKSVPAELFYTKQENGDMEGTEKLKELKDSFRNELVQRAARVWASKPKYEPPPREKRLKKCAHSSDSSDDSSSDDESYDKYLDLEEMQKKSQHPYRLHQELWYNDLGEMNDGPLCRCSAKACRTGIRHGIYPGETPLKHCNPNTNNRHRLHHYRVTMSPHVNFLVKSPTSIFHNEQEYIFEGFSMFSHEPLGQLPICKVIRFNIEYTVLYIEEEFPENFTVEELDLFYDHFFVELLELVDLDWKAFEDKEGCPRFHFMPRFVRGIEDNGKELLSMNHILQYLLDSNKLLVEPDQLSTIDKYSHYAWQSEVDKVRGMIITKPGFKPCSLRVDQLDREVLEGVQYPEVVHFGLRPPQLSYAGNPSFQKAWRDYVKFRHLLANKSKVEYSDRNKLETKENKLKELRMKSNMKRDVTVVVSSDGFYKTGIMCDMVQHALLIPVLICHLRFHQSLHILESQIRHKFHDRYLLQLALTHPSYRENFGTNPDHIRNSLTNCGIRQPEYGDRRIHYMNTRKRGINTLINIMSRFGHNTATNSNINHNERLEFLGDAVVEFLTSIHLFFMFPDLEEGGLATYRAAIVQNQHLAVLAKTLKLDHFLLYAHGSDLCHDLELRHATANCMEALMGAIFLDAGIDVADNVFSETLFPEKKYQGIWKNLPRHPLQEQEPNGDRRWIETIPILKKLVIFEETTGIEFTHIRLLARAFTHRSIGYNNLTMGSNQRLEFLGDTILQLIASEYLYKFFPDHHEGHLSLLRSSLVNNRTQAVVCNDLGMADFAIYPESKVELKPKDRADLMEAFLGALYIDKGLEFCKSFCQVCFFPRLQDFILNQDWNDPKSKLQQCCLTLRTMEGGEPDIPIYKVIECMGPTNTRIYTVAVYFRDKRLATGSGHSIQDAEMAAANNALESTDGDLFPQLAHQRRVIERSLKYQKPPGHSSK